MVFTSCTLIGITASLSIYRSEQYHNNIVVTQFQINVIGSHGVFVIENDISESLDHRSGILK